MYKNENVYSLSYGKELLLRDSEKFFKNILFFSLINDNNIYNTAFALISKKMILKLGSRKNFLFPFYIAVNFLSSDIPDFHFYKMSFNTTKYIFNDIYQKIIEDIEKNIEILKKDKIKLCEYFEIFENEILKLQMNENSQNYLVVNNYKIVLKEYINNYFEDKSVYLLIKGFIMLNNIENIINKSKLDLVKYPITKL